MTATDGTVVGTTKIVDHGPSAARWDLVIMGDGYRASELDAFAADVDGFVEKLFATEPFSQPALASVINVHRVDVTSTDSGADDPTACGGTGRKVRTYFDASFCRDGSQQRVLGVNETTALTVAGAQVPNWNVVMIIVNTTIYGGGGGPVGVFSLGQDANGNPASESGLHELGHTAFRFADEYDNSGPPQRGGDHAPPFDFFPNIASTVDRDKIDWADLINESTPLPTTANPDCSTPDPRSSSPLPLPTVGAFEGANYFHCGAYRAQFTCRMRALGKPFCAVCQRVIHDHLATFNTDLEFRLAGFGAGAAGWSIDRHPRFLVDTTFDQRLDVVGFSDDGVYVSRYQPDGTYGEPKLVVAGFGANVGGWSSDRHPRFMADTTADGRADIVGFGDDGVWIARAQPDGGFVAQSTPVVQGFGYNAGWRVDRHPRFLADTTGDRRADIVGFSDDGVYVSRAQPDGSFTEPKLVVAGFGANVGGWSSDRHPRFMADTTADGRADIVGFGNDGVWIARAQPDGSYVAQSTPVVQGFGYNAGWRVDRHPRFLADTTGDRRADIVGFSDDGVYVSRAQPDGTFTEPKLVLAEFGLHVGGWLERHPRFAVDTTGDGRADLVGFGDGGVLVSRSQPNGRFSPPFLAVKNFGADTGWTERHLRIVADLTPDDRGAIVGFGDDGVWTVRHQVR